MMVGRSTRLRFRRPAENPTQYRRQKRLGRRSNQVLRAVQWPDTGADYMIRPKVWNSIPSSSSAHETSSPAFVHFRSALRPATVFTKILTRVCYRFTEPFCVCESKASEPINALLSWLPEIRTTNQAPTPVRTRSLWVRRSYLFVKSHLLLSARFQRSAKRTSILTRYTS